MVSGVAFRRTRGPSRRTRRASWREERQSGMWLRTLIETAQSKEASRKGGRWAAASGGGVGGDGGWSWLRPSPSAWLRTCFESLRTSGKGGRLFWPQFGGGAADHGRCEVAKGDGEAGAGAVRGGVGGGA